MRSPAGTIADLTWVELDGKDILAMEAIGKKKSKVEEMR
jgi:hypothetical protein